MNWLNNIKVAIRLPLVTVLALVSLVIFAAVTFSTVNAIKVGGPSETQINTDNKVLADIAPPMANLATTDFWLMEAYIARCVKETPRTSRTPVTGSTSPSATSAASTKSG